MRMMMKLLNFLGCLAALVVSLGLFFVLMAGAGMYAAQSALEPEMLQQLLMTAAMPEQSDPQIATDPENALARQMLESELTRDLLELYTDDLFAQMDGSGSRLNGEALYGLAREHMEELIPLVRLLAEESGADVGEISDGEIETQVMALVEDYGGALLQHLPTLEDMGVTPMPAMEAEEILAMDMAILDRLMAMDFRREDLSMILTQIMALLHEGTGMKLLLSAAGILSLLILFLRLGASFRGFTWLCWDYVLAGGLSLCLGFGGMSAVSRFAYQMNGQVLNVLQQLVNPYLLAGGVILGAGILLGVISGVGNSLLAKRGANKRNDA